MRNNDIESSLKRFLKRKVKITLGVVVAFLITGVVGYGGENGSITTSTNITENKTITLTKTAENNNRYGGIVNETESEITLKIDEGKKLKINSKENSSDVEREY